jgi:dolichol-phosphate mannosyltransferase
MKNTLIIIPTYNELTNIGRMIPELLKMYPDVNILIVDDNSPDGTGKFVKEYMEKDNRIHILEREGKMGLGTAYVAGFKYMLENSYEYAVQMDADFSHDPRVIKLFLDNLDSYDLIIGSRYISGVNVINWPMSRLLLSYFANIYTRIITGIPVKDSTGGYKCFKRKVLESLDLNKIHSNGYAFQIEINFKVWKKGFSIFEIPIIFMDRIEGQSKMSKKIVREAVWMVWKLRIQSLFGKL